MDNGNHGSLDGQAKYRQCIDNSSSRLRRCFKEISQIANTSRQQKLPIPPAITNDGNLLKPVMFKSLLSSALSGGIAWYGLHRVMRAPQLFAIASAMMLSSATGLTMYLKLGKTAILSLIDQPTRESATADSLCLALAELRPCLKDRNCKETMDLQASVAPLLNLPNNKLTVPSNSTVLKHLLDACKKRKNVSTSGSCDSFDNDFDTTQPPSWDGFDIQDAFPQQGDQYGWDDQDQSQFPGEGDGPRF